MRKWFLDSLLGIVGIGTSLVLFFIQSPEAKVKDWFLVLSPALVAVLLIVIHFTVKKFKPKLDALIAAKAYMERIECTKGITTCTIEILNVDGDIDWERTHTIKMIKSGTSLNTTKSDCLLLTEKSDKAPPVAHVTKSSIVNRKLSPINIEMPDQMINGINHHNLSWRYVIDPPLGNLNDEVSYKYDMAIPKVEKRAFTDQGSEFFFISDATFTEYECTLISPKGYKIEILDSFIEEPGNIKKELSSELEPKLRANCKILNWNPPYRPNSTYITKYRLVSTAPNESSNSDAEDAGS